MAQCVYDCQGGLCLSDADTRQHPVAIRQDGKMDNLLDPGNVWGYHIQCRQGIYMVCSLCDGWIRSEGDEICRILPSGGSCWSLRMTGAADGSALEALAMAF
jgi:hypothetical protein